MVAIIAFQVSLPELSLAEQNKSITKLERMFQQQEGVKQIKVSRSQDISQDSGTILSIILAGPAVVVAVKALNNWLTRTNQTKIRITTSDGRIIEMTNLESKDVPMIAAALHPLNGPDQ